MHDPKFLYQLLKQAVSDGEHAKNIKSLFRACQAYTEHNPMMYLLTNLDASYAIALWGYGKYECPSVERELYAGLRRLVDDMTDAGEDKDPETGEEFDSVTEARAVLSRYENMRDSLESISRRIEDAAKAAEIFGEDECEKFAKEMKK